MKNSQKKHHNGKMRLPRRLCGALLAAAVLCCALPPVLAEGEAAAGEAAPGAEVYGMTAQPGTTTANGYSGAADETFTYTVSFSALAFRDTAQTSTPQATGVQFTLAYDATLLEPTGDVQFFNDAAGSANSGKTVNLSAQAPAGDTDGLSHINVVWYDLDHPYTEALGGSGTAFCTVTFRAAQAFSRTAVTLEQLKLASGATTAGDSVTAVNAGTVAATFKNLEAKVLYGDTNSDGVVNILDVSYLQGYLANLVPAGEIDLAAADTNGDGSVNILDASWLQTYLLSPRETVLRP